MHDYWFMYWLGAGLAIDGPVHRRINVLYFFIANSNAVIETNSM